MADFTIPSGWRVLARHSNGRETLYLRRSDGLVVMRTVYSDHPGAVTQRISQSQLAHMRGLVQWSFTDQDGAA